MSDPWDIRPKAIKGDPAPDNIFHAVGVATTQWERLESVLAELFDLLLASGNRAAFKIYRSAKTSNARQEMLGAAVPVANVDSATNRELVTFVKTIGKYVARRNEIVHGQVFNLDEHGFYLAPSNLMKSKWTKERAAKYQYVANDVYYYAGQFAEIRTQCEALVRKLKSLAKTG